jgi:hypothetical protein
MSLLSDIEGVLPQSGPVLAGMMKRVIPMLPLDDAKKAALSDAVDRVIALEADGVKLASDIEAILTQ